MATIHQKYSERGFDILAFPCNQFGGQEPAKEPEIKEFVKKYNVLFTMMSKIHVNGDNTHPVYTFLKAQPGCEGNCMWNFRSKFLVSKDGKTVKRYQKSAADLGPEIEEFLDA
mmetsp:Transcript_67329/g.140273  ORF Transcript_67329/g.140273 Transcript_67329/m.140273 type:complete len:113 (+) Transcript_67329:227-565(+)